jgi:hypothetical protein
VGVHPIVCFSFLARLVSGHCGPAWHCLCVSLCVWALSFACRVGPHPIMCFSVLACLACTMHLGVMNKLEISLNFFGQIWVEFFLHQLSQSCFFTQLTFGNCVKIPNFGKCENWKNTQPSNGDRRLTIRRQALHRQSVDRQLPRRSKSAMFLCFGFRHLPERYSTVPVSTLCKT